MIVLSAGAVALMLQLALWRSMTFSYTVTLVTFMAAAVAVGPTTRLPEGYVSPLLHLDAFAALFTGLFCLAGAATAVIARQYLRARKGMNEEFFLLLILSTLGAVTLAYSAHVASLLLGLELMGVALYALIAYPERGETSLEASVKYLVLSGAASAILLFGFALLYAASGALGWETFGPGLANAGGALDSLWVATGAVMVLVGLAFKLSVVPFHMWTPDVYQGAPAPVSGFLAAVSKGAVFVAVLRWLLPTDILTVDGVLLVLCVVAVASILVGNLLALRQSNVKRVLAYSSVAHLGYLLVVLVGAGSVAGPAAAGEAGAYYVVAYVVTTLAAFALLSLVSQEDRLQDRDQIGDLTGLFWHRPGLALLFTVALLSLAGIPLTGGFIGKFYLITVAVESSLWLLLAALVLGSAMGIYYYLRIVYQMARQPETGGAVQAPALALDSGLVVGLLILMVLYLGILPEPLMAYLRIIT